MVSMPGVIVGDMGPKIGLNGVDNGFATFNSVRIPRENLLNRTGDVSFDGKYITPFKVIKTYICYRITLIYLIMSFIGSK